ncbi:DEAD/DEAH box helicase [Chitinophaga skermanii]|nr:DEAD/DEAH box helicase [Chitinophaga skermanii]
MTFKELNLNTSLLNALDELGFETPTTIQHKAFSVIMSGQDVCGIAQTGTGKTYAYLLPILRQLKFSKDRYPQVLILVPTRELVTQVVEASEKLNAYTSFQTLGVYGGVNMNPQVEAVKNGADIIVATPGRLYDLVLTGVLKLKNVKKLVIDEVDEMLNLGFRPQLTKIMDVLPARRQNLLFSATITDEVDAIIEDYFNNPARVEAAPVGTPLENILQYNYKVPNFYTKVNLLEHLLANNAEMSKVLVFASTKALADELFETLAEKYEGQVGVIHSNKDQKYRFNVVKQFKEGTYRFIIATDVIARGIDIEGVSHVINFDTPDSPENYIHRIGRTGRAESKGIAITFTTKKELPLKAKIEELMNYEIPVLPISGEVEISKRLIEDEMPKIPVKNLPTAKLPKWEPGGAAFHEKKAKNKKVNRKISHADKMHAKYGKPKTRGAKKK